MPQAPIILVLWMHNSSLQCAPAVYALSAYLCLLDGGCCCCRDLVASLVLNARLNILKVTKHIACTYWRRGGGARRGVRHLSVMTWWWRYHYAKSCRTLLLSRLNNLKVTEYIACRVLHDQSTTHVPFLGSPTVTPLPLPSPSMPLPSSSPSDRPSSPAGRAAERTAAASQSPVTNLSRSTCGDAQERRGEILRFIIDGNDINREDA